MRTFLLSPARLDGQRAQQLMREGASSALAKALRSREGVAIGEVFQFLSALYFRGKLTYAKRFAATPEHIQVITTNRGLIRADLRVTVEHLEAFAQTDIHADEPAFQRALMHDARALRGEVVLLGSIASSKYVDVLLEALGDRLVFPTDFVGRGDMSRGGLLLRAAESGSELVYGPVQGAVRHGVRPPKLAPKR